MTRSAFRRNGIFGIVFLVAGCGQPVCVAGFGQCQSMFANSSTTTTGTLTLTGPTTVTRSTQVSFVASGGTGVFTYSVLSPVGCGTFPTASVGTFTVGSIAEQCTLQAVDTTSPTPYTATIIITIQ